MRCLRNEEIENPILSWCIKMSHWVTPPPQKLGHPTMEYCQNSWGSCLVEQGLLGFLLNCWKLCSLPWEATAIWWPSPWGVLKLSPYTVQLLLGTRSSLLQCPSSIPMTAGREQCVEWPAPDRSQGRAGKAGFGANTENEIYINQPRFPHTAWQNLAWKGMGVAG